MIGPLILKEEERGKDEGGDDEREEGDANEAPKVDQALMKQRADAGGRLSLITEESSGNEEEIEEQIERDRCVADGGTGVSCGTFVKVQESFADHTQVEATGEALGGERVIEQGGELAVEAERKQEGEQKVGGVGPQEGGKAAESHGQTVEEDVAAFKHALYDPGEELRCELVET